MTTSALLIVIASYLILVVLMSCISFAAYGLDKRRAGNAGRRMPERTLHLLAMAGGWPGAFWGQRQFRHKTHKRSFQIVFWFTLFVHIAIVAAIAYGCLQIPPARPV